ncbi:MAG: hypothetical protein JJU15_06360 [Pararhodobacter sp.]|nr:hypothetical protein [Pararhodobacter sp.]
MPPISSIPARRYKSHEDVTGYVWIYIAEADTGYPWGDKVGVSASNGSYYHIHRIGRIGPREAGGIPSARIGDAGVIFEKRKDAENYALVAAMMINRDIRRNKNLANPEVFGGSRRHNTPEISRLRRSFWSGAGSVDVTEGWADLDPDGHLSRLPCDDPFMNQAFDDFDYEAHEGSLEYRGLAIASIADEVRKYFIRNVQRDVLRQPFLSLAQEVFSKQMASDWNPEDISNSDKSYCKLLVLAGLRDRVPADWVLPNQQAVIPHLVSQLVEELPTEAIEAIERHRAEKADAR